MTQLICQVQRLSLGDEKRTLVKENETFSVDREVAEQYVKGGIARYVPVEKQGEPEPMPEPQQKPEEIPDAPVQTETEAEKVTQKNGKKKGR
jgi:hypothetical protein